MSNPAPRAERDCALATGSEAIELLIQPRDSDLGGLSVRRLLPNARRRLVGPWIFFDHMGPKDFPAGQGIQVRPHPHINLATVTYLFDGAIMHRDSLGSEQLIRPGAINLMVAGRGIVHSERQGAELTAAAHRLDGLQLWLALPEADEEIEPAFHHYPANSLPQTEVDGVAVRVLMGSAFGLTAPVRTFAETLYVEARLRAGQRLAVPAAAERAVYVASGALRIGATALPAHAMAVLADQPELILTAEADSRIAIIGGEPLGQRHIWWNFVSSRRARIEQAKADWQAGRFPAVPGDADERMPLPD